MNNDAWLVNEHFLKTFCSFGVVVVSRNGTAKGYSSTLVSILKYPEGQVSSNLFSAGIMQVIHE